MSDEWKAWDAARAERYIQLFGPSHHPKAQHKDRVMHAASAFVGQSALDVGCGIGHLYGQLKTRAKQYVGVDGSADMLQRARQAWPEGDFRKGDVFDLSNVGRFDTVFCLSVLIHIAGSWEQAFATLWPHVVRRLVVSVPISARPLRRQARYQKTTITLRAEPQPFVQACLAPLPYIHQIKWQDIGHTIIQGFAARIVQLVVDREV